MGFEEEEEEGVRGNW
jgi:hypothetical protein